MLRWLRKTNEFVECKALRLRIWECPPFLVLILGLVMVVSMVLSYTLANRYIEEPELAALIVIAVTIVFLILGNLIINSFRRLVEANRMKTEFINIVSHQIRSPLSVFKWTLGILDRALKTKDTLRLESSLDTLRDSTEYMIRLVNSLLEASRIEAQRFTVSRKSFSLVEVTNSVLKNYSHYAAASNIILTFDSPHDPMVVQADEERIIIVIQNLLDNAIRYTKGSGKIVISIAKEDERIRWSIQDEGIGIPDSEQKHIFEKFFRAFNIQSQETHGSGLGLFIAKAIVDAHGGKMGFKSEEGKGSTFWFTLPTNKSSTNNEFITNKRISE